MTEVVRYVADDGTEFEDEYDCRVHEATQELKAIDGEFFFLDEGKNPIKATDFGNWDEVQYIFLANNVVGKKLAELWDCEVVDAYPPDFLYGSYRLGTNSAKAGLWAFDDRDDSWYHVGDKMAELQETADDCMAVINGGI